VLVPGFDNGGFFPGTWAWTTLACSCLAGLRVVLRGRVSLSRAEQVLLTALAALTLWTLLSGIWAVRGAAAGLEARRGLLYLAALAATVVCVDARRARSVLVGAIGGVVVLSIYAVADRAATGTPKRLGFEGTTLVGTLGYANALGILAASAIVLTLGLASAARPTWETRASLAATTTLAATLALTGSRGAALGLAAGLLVTLTLAPAEGRMLLLALLIVAAPAGAAAIALAEHVNGAWLIAAVGGPALLAGAAPRVRLRVQRQLQRLAIILAIALLAAGLAIASHSLSHRGQYWSVALHDARSHPVLGSGAGSFATVWLADRPIPAGAKDAHSLYLESLAELGLVGIALVTVVVAVPLAAAYRHRHVPVVPGAAGAYAAFVVHSGLDWDWEVPAVVLFALTAAGALLIAARRTQR